MCVCLSIKGSCLILWHYFLLMQFLFLRLAMAKTYFLLYRWPRTVDWSCHCTSQKYEYKIFICSHIIWVLWHYNKNGYRYNHSWRNQTCCWIFLQTGSVTALSCILKWVDLKVFLTKWWRTTYRWVRLRSNDSSFVAATLKKTKPFWFLIFLFLVELCLTSNVKGQTVPCYSKHHFKYWYQLGHPSVICVS